MTPADFRRIALAQDGAVEGSHMCKADFRVGKTIFATLGYPDPNHAMCKVAPEEQAMLVQAEPEVFRPVPNAWGRQGCTLVRLEAADEATLRSAVAMAWRRVTGRP